MNGKEIREMMLSISRDLIEKEEVLCQLDSYVGDGDHGVTVARGFREVEKMLLEKEYNNPIEIFKEVGNKLSITMGGAIGPILGSFFSAGTKQLEEVQQMNQKEFDVIFAKGLEQIQLIGGAAVGDRTMVDALAPAVQAFHLEAEKHEDLAICLEEAYKAAVEGAESTKNLQARKGRAKFLGEKSLGYVDAGATTISLIIKAMCVYVVTNSCAC